MFRCYFQTFCVAFLELWRISEIFQKKSENFRKNLKFSEKFLNPEIFCCQPFKNGWKLTVLLVFHYFWQFPGTKSCGKLAVLLLFSKFLRCFSRILTNVRNFSEFFETFLKFLRKIWFFFKKLWIQGFSAATHSKMDENWLFCCCFQIFQLVFHYFWQFPGTKSCGKLAVSLLFSNFLRCFSRTMTNFRNFPEISENFL